MTDAPAPTPPATKARRRVPRWVWFVVTCVSFGAVTSVGVAWGIAWHRDSRPLYALHTPGGIRVVRAADGAAERFSLVVDRDGWDRGLGVLTMNSFAGVPTANVLDLVAHASQSPRFDEEASFTRLTHDGASQRALARHLPLLRTEDGCWVRFQVTHAGWPARCLAFEEACTLKDAIGRKRGMYFSSGATDAPMHIPNPKATITDPAFNLLTHYSAIEIGDRLLPTFPLWPGLLANTAIYGGAWAVVICVPVLLRRWRRARRGGCPQCGYSREGLKVDAPCPECGRTPPAAHDATPTLPSTSGR